MQVANLLKSCTVHGELVLLCYPPGLDFIAALYGCLHIGRVPVPIFPPNTRNPKMGLDRMRSVLESTHLHVGLTSSKMLRYLKVLRVLHFKSPQVLSFSLSLSPPLCLSHVYPAAHMESDKQTPFLQGGDPHGVERSGLGSILVRIHIRTQRNHDLSRKHCQQHRNVDCEGTHPHKHTHLPTHTNLICFWVWKNLGKKNRERKLEGVMNVWWLPFPLTLLQLFREWHPDRRQPVYLGLLIGMIFP